MELRPLLVKQHKSIYSEGPPIRASFQLSKKKRPLEQQNSIKITFLRLKIGGFFNSELVFKCDSLYGETLLLSKDIDL